MTDPTDATEARNTQPHFDRRRPTLFERGKSTVVDLTLRFDALAAICHQVAVNCDREENSDGVSDRALLGGAYLLARDGQIETREFERLMVSWNNGAPADRTSHKHPGGRIGFAAAARS